MHTGFALTDLVEDLLGVQTEEVEREVGVDAEDASVGMTAQHAADVADDRHRALEHLRAIWWRNHEKRIT